MGNANVKTDTFTVAANQWATNTFVLLETVNNGTPQAIPCLSYPRPNNSITQDVMDNGLVLAYLEPTPDFTPEYWYPLPYTFPVYNSSSAYQYNTDFVYITYAGGITIDFYFAQEANGVTPPIISLSPPAVNYRFKVISVTGQAGVFMAQNHVNLKDYTAVSRALGLWQQDKVNNSHFH